jgi:hypothetical protein
MKYKITDCRDSRDCQIEMDALFSNQPGAKNDWNKLTQAEKKRYFKLRDRQDKFREKGK